MSLELSAIGLAEYHPTRADILLGRGTPYQRHLGNIWLGQIVEQRRRVYKGTKDKVEKTVIASGIVQDINKMGGRFLKQREAFPSSATDFGDNPSGGDNDNANKDHAADVQRPSGWEEVDFVMARRKVVNCFNFWARRVPSDPSIPSAAGLSLPLPLFPVAVPTTPQTKQALLP